MALLMGDPRYLMGLAAYPCAFLDRRHRDLLEAVAVPLREERYPSKADRMEYVLDRLEAEGKGDLADLLVTLAADAVKEEDRRRPWASVECGRRSKASTCRQLVSFRHRLGRSA